MLLPAHIQYNVLPISDVLENNFLSETELARMATFGNEIRKKQFAIGRNVLKQLVAARLDRTPEDVVLHVEESGALCVSEAHHLYISLSHTHSHVAAILAETPVGIDIEQIKPRRNDLWRYILHPDEIAPFHALALPEVEKLILFWTLKESVLKGLKTGFRLSPKKLRATVDLEMQMATMEVLEAPESVAASEKFLWQQRWQLAFEQQQDYYTAIAWKIA